MIFDRVTITGADDSVRLADLWDLSQAFPFVEWGILVSPKREGSPRYPSEPWLRDLCQALIGVGAVRLSLHVCGQWCRDLVQGFPTLAELRPWLWGAFDRVQLNFGADHCRTSLFYPMLKALARRGARLWQYVFPLRGAGHELTDGYYAEALAEGVPVAPLFDASGGQGRVPDVWPRVALAGPGGALAYHGYAGGLGPENLDEQLRRIEAVAGDARVWVDMERNVRTPDDARLDLARVRRCLEIAAPWVARPASTSVPPSAGPAAVRGDVT